MATLVFTAIGTLVGGPIGGAIGALAGQQVDKMLIGGGKTIEGPRLTELAVTTSSYGMAIPRHFGAMRTAGQIIWATDLAEHRDRQSNGKGKPSTVTYSYSASFAVALSSRRLRGIGRIWADGKLLRGAAGDLKSGGTMRFYSGCGDQAPDPLIAAHEGLGNCPAWRGIAYVVFEDLQLADYGNRIPALSFEIFADDAPLNLSMLLDGVIANHDANLLLSGLTGLSCEGSVAEALAMLAPVFPIDCDACSDQLAIRPDALQAAPLALDEPAVSAADDGFGGAQGFARKRDSASEPPLAALRYYDVDRDYLPGVQRATGRSANGQPRTLELPAAMSASAASTAISQAAHNALWGRETLSWRSACLDPAIRPGTQVTVAGMAGRWKVRDWEWRADGIELLLLRVPGHAANVPLSGTPGRAANAPDDVVGQTSLVVCEMPWDGNQGTALPQILAMAASGSNQWAGASLYVDHGDATLQPLATTTRNSAVIGAATQILPKACPLLFDRSSSVIVALTNADMTLPSATMRQLAMGANQALLGPELIQFTEAVPLGDAQWRISGLWRGRGGTENAVGSHTMGEPFALLDGAGVMLDGTAVGEVPDTTIAAIGLGDSNPVVAQIMLRGIGRRPLTPVHARLTLLADNTRRITWTRRARGGWQWLDYVDVPINEQIEAYEVSFGDGDSIIAQWSTDAPTLDLDAAQIGMLLAQAPGGTLSIRQRGDFNRSEPLLLQLV